MGTVSIAATYIVPCPNKQTLATIIITLMLLFIFTVIVTVIVVIIISATYYKTHIPHFREVYSQANI